MTRTKMGVSVRTELVEGLDTLIGECSDLGARWSIERLHRKIKQHLGADEFQERSWDGFYRHLAVVMLAHAFIATHRLEIEQILPSFEDVIQRIVCEAAIQQLQDN